MYGALADSDVIAFLVDARQAIGPGDRRIAERLDKDRSKVVVLVNKTDRFSKEKVVSCLVQVARGDFGAYVPISALRGDNLEAVVSEITGRLPEGPMYFPPGAITDQPDSFFASEVVREKFLAGLRHELPHSLLVTVEDFHVRSDGLVNIAVKLVVESPSQKGIVIEKVGPDCGRREPGRAASWKNSSGQRSIWIFGWWWRGSGREVRCFWTGSDSESPVVFPPSAKGRPPIGGASPILIIFRSC